MTTQPETRGFWRGLATGLVLTAALGLALAYAFPPQRLEPPQVTPGSLLPPGAPGVPSGTAEPAPPRSGGLLPAPAPAPLIADVPAPETPPDPRAYAPAPGALGGASGSPSLVPAQGN